MRSFLIRVLKYGLISAAALALVGALAANVAGMLVASDRDSGEAVAETLRVRLPVGMAAWGFGVVAVIEVFRAVWPATKKTATPEPPKTDPMDDAEKLLLQLLEQADAAERARQIGPRSPVPLQSPRPVQ